MALIDKVKAQASQLAQKAQEAGKAGQAKIVDVQARRRADGLLRELGAAVFAQHSSGAGDKSAEIERLIRELTTFESENGPLDDEGANSGPEADTPPEGGFTL